MMTVAMKMCKNAPIQLKLDSSWVMENYNFAGAGDRPGTWELCLLRVSQTWSRQEVGIFSEDRPNINMVRVCGGNDPTGGYDGVCVEERAGGGIDGYTYSCRHDTASYSDVALEGQEKGRLGEGPTMTGELPK